MDPSQEVLGALLPETGKSVRIGITGVPGVGKSTFIEAFGKHVSESGHRVAVLAIDPSSPYTGGSILGDKTRMQELSRLESVFIRPSPTGGTLGGVARKTRESMLLCEAAGYDVILVETVGVGQSEFEVSAMTDIFLVLMLPNAGDSLQGIKRGILELADLMLVNKADGDQEKRAQKAQQEYRHALHLVRPKYPDIPLEVDLCSALTGTGIPVAWDKLQQRAGELKEKGYFDKNRESQLLHWARRLTEGLVINQLWNDPATKKTWQKEAELLKQKKQTPLETARRLAQIGKMREEEE